MDIYRWPKEHWVQSCAHKSPILDNKGQHMERHGALLEPEGSESLAFNAPQKSVSILFNPHIY